MLPSHPDFDKTEVIPRLEAARRFARAAGTLTLRHYQSHALVVESKEDASPVTVADRAAEELLRDKISAEFPDDSILGEEFGEAAGRSGFRWVLDPIDGTQAFVRGVPLYGTLVGIDHRGDSLIGIIELPALGESIYAWRGGGAWWQRGEGDPAPARVGAAGTLAEATLVTTAPYGMEGAQATAFEALAGAAGVVRGWGDCYGYALVATGRAHVMVDPGVHIWDAAPLKVILEEAGGRFTDWQGEATIFGYDAIGTNGTLHDAVLSYLRQAARPPSAGHRSVLR